MNRRRNRILLAFTTFAVLVPSLDATPAAATGTRARERTSRQSWSDPATWNGRPPREGDRVTIPHGTHVVLDVSPPPLAGLQVDGTLAFARKDLTLTSDSIVVHGTLRVGSHKRPFRQNAVITLTGNDASADVMGMGTKVLGVMGGKLELHGEPRPSWTRLGATVEAGGRRIRLLRRMPWESGDRIVLASSDYWQQHDEVRTIASVSDHVVELDSPLEYRHWGDLQTFEGRVVDERAEVGLLTRNVVVRGDASSTERGFGGHLMAMDGARVRIEGVELDRMGQRLALRRYPVHFHMEGDASGSYLRRSSIHDSFNRCVVVHGTSGLLIHDNVCFDHPGHGFFLEDGIETDNVFSHNLGLGTTKVDKGLLPSDERPATFWITNPDNVLRNNAAAGSDGTGFWYALPQHPTGLSEDAGVWPRRTPLGRFSGNVAHSNRIHGLDVDHGPTPTGAIESAPYVPRSAPHDASSPPVTARFEGLTAYMNRDRGVWLRGENLVVSGAALADNKTGATFAAREAFLEDSVVVGESANPGTTEPWEKSGPGGRALPAFWRPDSVIGGFEFYDGRVGVRDTTFAGFVPNDVRQAGALTYLAPNAFALDPNNFAQRVRFVASNPVYLAPPAERMDGDVSKVIVDRDGSVTGTAGTAIVVDNPFLLNDACELRADWNARLCRSDYVTLMMGGLTGGREPISPLTIRRDDGAVQRLFGCCTTSRDAITTIVPNRSYRATFNGTTPAETRLVLIRARDRWVQISLPTARAPQVTRWRHPVEAVASLEALATARDSASYYDRDSGLVHVRIHGKSDWEEIRITSP